MSNNLVNLIARINTLKTSVNKADELNTVRRQGEGQHMVTLFYFIGLAARLAEIDDATNDDELAVIISVFPSFLNAADKIKRLYYSAVADKTPALNFAKKIKDLYPNNYLLMQQIAENLIKIADADQPINTLEYMFIDNILNEFNFAIGTIDRLIESYFFQANKTVFEILGVQETASIQDINNAYKAKIMKLHPDKIYSHSNIAPVYKKIFERKYQEVSNAYKSLLKLRELS